MILAIDPGLAHCGYALLSYDGEPHEMGVIRTEKSAAKRQILSTDDHLRRVREMTDALDGLINRGARVLATESMSFPRNAANAAKLAMCWASFATLSELRGLPLLQLSPQEVRKRLSLPRNASKEDVAFAVEARLGKAQVNAPLSLWNHAYDAAAVGLGVLSSDVVRALRGRAA